MKEILIVDDHEIIRNGIGYYFKGDNNLKITGEASSGIEALELLAKQSFDIMLTDISMPGMDGVALIQEARKDYPGMKIVALTMHGEAHMIKQVIKENVDGYILKNSGRKLLIEALHAIMNEEKYFDENATKALIQELSKKTPKKDRPVYQVKLSSREKEVLKLITEENSNQEIAEKLFISHRTVETHKTNLLTKTGAKNVAGLVMYAIENDLI